MGQNQSVGSGDSWLTPRDAELLHVLADSLPDDARRSLAKALRGAGDVPAEDEPPRAAPRRSRKR